MHRIALTACLLLLLAFPARTQAQEAQADAAPPAGSPREAALAFFRGFTAGDPAVVRGRVYAADDEERKVIDAMTRTADAIARARQMAATKIGPDAGKAGFEMMPERIILSAREQVEGDKATLFFDANPGMVLKRVDGRWRLWLTEMLKSTKQTAPQLAKEVAETAARVDIMTREIEAGRIKTAEDVGRALGEAAVSRGR